MGRLLATALAALSVAGPTSAQFITSDSSFGVDSLVTDTISGTTWLNLDVTLGMSLNTVTANLAVNPSYSDFRLATLREVDGLFGDAGFCVGDVPCNITDPSRHAAGVSFVNAFDDDGTGRYIGYLGTLSYPIAPSEGIFGTWRTVVSFDPTGPYVGHAWDDFTGPASSQSLADTGTWLVSKNVISPVPEPSSYALMFAGLGVVGVIARRRAKS